MKAKLILLTVYLMMKTVDALIVVASKLPEQDRVVTTGNMARSLSLSIKDLVARRVSEGQAEQRRLDMEPI